MAKFVMLHRQGYSYNLYTSFEDQLKDVGRPWKFGMICITKIDKIYDETKNQWLR